MKKSLFFAAAAVAVLASCSQDEKGLDLNIANENQAIEFNAFASTAVTRGIVNTVEDFQQGIGVFAFYQPSNNGNKPADYTTIKYPTPNFMYNQKIQYDATNTNWYYSPVKYWPNNKNDELSFFAYAPYTATTTWEDLNITTDATGATIMRSFYVFNEVENQKDYLFAEPLLNKTKPTEIYDSLDAPYAAADSIGAVNMKYNSTQTNPTYPEVIRFDFKHIMSKINLFVGVYVDDTLNSAGSDTLNPKGVKPEKWLDPNTKITIESIEFKDLYQTYAWTSSASPKWKGDGSQNIKVKPSADDNADTIKSATWTNDKWHRVLGYGKKSGTDKVVLNDTTNNDQYMFLAPQIVADKEIVITYIVDTKDSKAENCSTVKNVITKKWSDLAADFKLEGGTQYRLYFLIGMKSVKVAATITDWVDASNPDLEVEVPANY